MRLIFAAATFVAAPVCASVAFGQGTGTLYVTREKTFAAWAVDTQLSIDGQFIGSVTNGGCVKLTVPAGTRELGVAQSLFGNVFGTKRGNATFKVPSGGVVTVTAIARMEYPGPVHWTDMIVTKNGKRC